MKRKTKPHAEVRRGESACVFYGYFIRILFIEQNYLRPFDNDEEKLNHSNRMANDRLIKIDSSMRFSIFLFITIERISIEEFENKLRMREVIVTRYKTI